MHWSCPSESTQGIRTGTSWAKWRSSHSEMERLRHIQITLVRQWSLHQALPDSEVLEAIKEGCVAQSNLELLLQLFGLWIVSITEVI